MIREIAVQLGEKLEAKGCPVPVIYRRERNDDKPVAFANERVVVERDHDGNDAFGPARSQHENPKQYMTRKIAAKITIYAQSPETGAQEFEHERRADDVLDQVLVAMHEIASERQNQWTPAAGRYVDPKTLEASEEFGGSVYELKFTFDRGVFKRKWDGSARPTTTVAGVTNTMTASLNGPDSEE